MLALIPVYLRKGNSKICVFDNQLYIFISIACPPPSINCIPDLSKDKLSLATVTLVNADENQFNNANISLMLQLSCPILDIYNYSISINDIPITSSTNTTSSITILTKFDSDKVIVSLVALDIYGLPIFVSFDLYLGSISMPVHVSFQNGTSAAGVLVRANLTDSIGIGQSGYTNENGTVVFTNVPLRTISLFARTIDNEIALTGIAPSLSGVSLVLLPFGSGISTKTAVFSTMKDQNVSINSSGEQFLRHVTKRDVELPGFTVTTIGQELQMVSKTLMTEKNSTSVYVRYKFVTSEVPGGYFGSRFNDYFTVTIRSARGNYETLSQSMNGLGLGAFDYASGATNWYTLKLKVSEEPERIQIDVGVANVADSAYPSSVIIDKIGIEKCDKCSNDCDKCKSDPMCRDTCLNPPMKSCLFYTDCMEAKVSCGASGYAIGYGSKYCNKYVNRLAFFTSQGQDWIYKVMICLQKGLVVPLKNCDNNCETLKQIAFASHPGCYINSGVCDLPVKDFINIIKTVGGDLTDMAALKQALQTVTGCGSRYILEIENAIVNAIDSAKIELSIMLKFIKSLINNS